MTVVARIVARRQAGAVARVAAVMRAEFPDIGVEAGDAAVTLVGAGLSRRRIEDARLRTIGVTVREAGT
jgi:hypothetical protein